MSRLPASDDEAFAMRLAACSPEDFDGHTEFANLPPEQRIEWLEQAAWFVWECRKEDAHLVHGGAGSRTVDPPNPESSRG